MAGDMTGDEARALRRGLGLSARALAIEVGTNESSVYRWEWRREREVPRMFARAVRDLVRERAARQAATMPPSDPSEAISS
jgi:DNA-binding transcriptional regulator YiaG